MGPMNGLKAIAVAIVLFALAFGSGFELLFRLAYAVLVIVVLSILWTWVNLLRLDLQRDTRTQRAQVGQFIEERFILRNRLPIPKLWVEVRDHSTLPDHHVNRAFALPMVGNKSWTVRTRCRRRGKHLLGPISVISGDPFGLFRRRRHMREVRPLIVYPATVELPHLSIPLGQLPGGDVLRRRSYHTTPNALGIRPYVPGDGLNQIHWLSTARLGSLTVKEFELDPLSDMWVVLDAARAVQVGAGDDSTEEYGVTIAASLARHFLQQHRAVGLIAFGSSPCVLPADRGDRQLIKIMEELAVLRATGRTPLAEVLATESARFGRNTTVIAISPSLCEDWVLALRHEARRGVRGVAIVLAPDSFGGTGSPGLIRTALATAQIPSFLVRLGDDLPHCLAVPSALSPNGKVS